MGCGYLMCSPKEAQQKQIIDKREAHIGEMLKGKSGSESTVQCISQPGLSSKNLRRQRGDMKTRGCHSDLSKNILAGTDGSIHSVLFLGNSSAVLSCTTIKDAAE